MDPTANLKEQRELTERLLNIRWVRGRREMEDYQEKTERLCELVKALDEWIRGGGVLPEPWQAGWRR